MLLVYSRSMNMKIISEKVYEYHQLNTNMQKREKFLNTFFPMQCVIGIQTGSFERK